MFLGFRIVRAAVAATASLTLLAAGAVVASGQGLYYREIRKDDRIYVFNVAANAERFEKSGEMGVAITKLGAGPNGETIVGDNERALQLFFYKYGIPEVVQDPPAPPPPTPGWRISGYVFGDYYYFAEDHDAKVEGQHGFWLRRAYFTYDHTLSPKFAIRLRLEMNSNGKFAGGALTPYVKDAYLRWTYYGRQQVMLGIQPTLSFDFVESVWGLRHIEKTPLDLYKWDSSRDFGVTLSGPMNEANTLKYAVQYGNESGSNAETDVFKAVRVAARYEPSQGFFVEGMFAQFARDKDADRLTAQVFGGYRAKKVRVGAQVLVPATQGCRRVHCGGSEPRHRLGIRRVRLQAEQGIGVPSRRSLRRCVLRLLGNRLPADFERDAVHAGDGGSGSLPDPVRSVQPERAVRHVQHAGGGRRVDAAQRRRLQGDVLLDVVGNAHSR